MTSIKGVSIGLLSLTVAGCTSQADQPKQPNIVYILADDLGRECIGAYGSTYSTPNIDSMAQHGILYRNMHSMPLSCPSRVQSLTGRYNYKNYVAFGYMNPDENTFAHLAKQAGYNTAMVGKWQLGKDRSLPTKCGFDEFCLFQLESYKERSERYANAIVDRNGDYFAGDSTPYGPTIFQEYAFDFIDRSAKQGKPFLLYYTTPLVHAPFTPTPDSESWDIVDTREEPDTANFRDMVAYMDRQVGQLIAKLKRDGLYDNTIVIFTSDNGTSTKVFTPMKDGSVVQGGKGETTDVGTHVPLVITYGDRVANKGVISERLVDLSDFMPTFADAMGVGIPAQWDIDGISLYPEISGGAPLQREWTLCHFSPLWPTTVTPNESRAVRDAQYKLYHDGRFYDTSLDIKELNPITPGTGTELAEAIRTKFQAVLNSLPAWKPGDQGQPRRGNYGTFYDVAEPHKVF